MTAPLERIETQLADARARLTEIEDMVNTERRVVAAEQIKVETAISSPQIIKATEDGGTIKLGSDSSFQVVDLLNLPVSHTGDTDETTVHTSIIRANKMGPKGAIRVASVWHATGVAAASQYLIYFGQAIAANRFGLWQAVHFGIDSRPLYVWNQEVTDAQLFVTDLQWMHTHSLSVGHPEEVAVDTTQDVSVYFRVKNFDVGTTAYLDFAMTEVLHRD